MKLPMPTATVATSTRMSEPRSSRCGPPAPPSSSHAAASARAMPAALAAVGGSPSSATASAAVITKLSRNTGALMLIEPVFRLYAKL